MGNGGFIMKKQKLIMHTVPTTNVRHFFVTYLFILKDKFQKVSNWNFQQLKNKSTVAHLS